MSYDDRRYDERRERSPHGRHDHDCGHRHHDRGHRHDDCGRDHHDCDRDHDDCGRDHRDGGRDFDEKRIIDTIVRLVSERIERVVEEHQASAHRQNEGGDEKRIVDLIVGLVSEHVQEIVVRELDCRLGKRPPGESDAAPASDPPEPDQP